MRGGYVRLRQMRDALCGGSSVHLRQNQFTALGLSRRLLFLLRKPTRPRGIEAVEEKSSKQRKRGGKSEEHSPTEDQCGSPREAGPQECLCGRVQIADVER